jgi:hypothetical protein
VLLAGSEVDNVSRTYIDGRFALSLRPPLSGDYVEDLAFGVRVPVGACPGFEEHAEDPGIGRRVHGLSAYPHGAGEPLLRGATGLHVSCRD